MRPLLALMLAGLFLPTLRAEEKTGGAKVYKQSVASVVWIHSKRDNGSVSGSGALIDAEKRYVLTNYHVVGDRKEATVCFPEYRNDEPIAEKAHYHDRLKRLGIEGRVVAVNQKVDLALIRLDKIPNGTKAIPIAKESAGPGDSVHSIGNAGKSGALWGYVKGTVRQVYRKKWDAALDKRTTLHFEAKVVETDSPTNPGDSGGPLLNDKGELVGVTQGGAVDAQLVSYFVDLSEVKKLLDGKVDEKKPEKGPEGKPKGKRESAIRVDDRARIFSKEAVAAADKEIAEFYKKEFDAVVETYDELPGKFGEKAKEAKGNDERSDLFREFCRDRMKELNAQGVYIVICLNPKYARVYFETRRKFPEAKAKAVSEGLLAGLKKQKPDDGLADALKAVREGLAEGEK